tara:strand:- start:167 stop:370 length:204 start_codon:yes stop_codon:yes gene_type:complete
LVDRLTNAGKVWWTSGDITVRQLGITHLEINVKGETIYAAPIITSKRYIPEQAAMLGELVEACERKQ